jgi:hypothetical protein
VISLRWDPTCDVVVVHRKGDQNLGRVPSYGVSLLD